MLELFFAELTRAGIQFRRYLFESIGGIVISTSVFYGLFLSASYIAGPGLQFGNRLDAIIVGYVLWTLVLFIMANISGTLQREAQTGTLEQLFISPFSASQVFLTRAVADLLLQSGLIAAILVIIMTLTGRWLAFPLSLWLPLLTVLLGAYGLSFAIGSLALIVKRIQQVLGIFQFALLFLMSVPTEEWTGGMRVIGNLLPMSPGAGLLRDVMARQQSLNLSQLGIALVNGGVYFAIGLLLFRWAERQTKRRGNLSDY
ncbi:MAG: ABC transporter permease [Lyngbya sp. HA4199-MV5]|jgi:ABC-2 type transport system permease protein|nr:ABC transporter permease [Lyngbya sp. HA4199-MV5]